MSKGLTQFIEIPDEIPYKKIKSFKVNDITFKDNQFIIEIDRKCENLPLEKQYTIVRKTNDFQWLVSQLAKQSPQVIALPIVMQSTWSFIQTITNKIFDQSKVNLKKWSNQQLLCKVAQRFLKLLNDVCLPFIYVKHGFTQTSLFTFLDSSYDLYKLQTYQKQLAPKEALIQNNQSRFASIAQTLSKGGIKLLGMLNVFQQSNGGYLKNSIKTFTQMETRIKLFNSQLQDILKSMQVLIDNFLNEAGLKKKYIVICQIFYRSSNCLKMTTQVFNQAKQVQKRIAAFDSKNYDKQIIEQQVKQYQKFITKDVQQINGKFQAILNEYYRKAFQEQVQIKISSLYPSKI